MKIPRILSLFTFKPPLLSRPPGHLHASPPVTVLGPATHDILNQTVATHHAEQSSNGTDADHPDGTECLGVYMCAGYDFTGDCYWACYPFGLSIYPDPYWVTRILSVGPDMGGNCTFYGSSMCGGAAANWNCGFPGGNLFYPWIAGKMGCFLCYYVDYNNDTEYGA